MVCHYFTEFFRRPGQLQHVLVVMFGLQLVLGGGVASAQNASYDGLVNLDDRASVTKGRYYFDRGNDEVRLTATIANTSNQDLHTPIVLAVTGLPSNVSLVQDGTLADGTPCVDFSQAIPSGVLAPGASSQSKQVAFYAPTRVRLGPTFSVWGMPSLKVEASGQPSTGPVPLTVVFSATTVGQIVLYEWDFTSDGTFDWQSATTASTSHTYTTVGNFTATIRVTDSTGASATDTVAISTQSGIESRPQAAPTSGTVPLTVTFTPAGWSARGTIIQYSWDYDGNGSWDWSYGRNDPTTRTYSSPGTYEARLRVTDNQGLTDIKSVTITVVPRPPTATASINPTNGPAPVPVVSSGSGSSPNGAIVLYEWDFDGDGVFDWSSASTGNTTHTYTTPGDYQPVFRITDAIGLVASVSDLLIEVRVGPPQSPTAKANASPTQGNAPLSVSFNSSGSSDVDGSIVLYEWDFDYDGTFSADWSSASSGSTSHSYTVAGPHYAALRVTDNDGMSAIDLAKVTVLVNVSLAITNHTFNPPVGELGGVRTTLSAAVPVSIRIKDRGDNVVRTLLENQLREAGTHDDFWNGMDDSGAFLPDGPYFAVLEYTLGDEVFIHDLTHTTGGGRYVPSRDSWPSYFQYSLYENVFPPPITFTLPKPSEMTIYIGHYNYNIRVREIMNRRPFGAGRHTVIWDGLDDQGKMATTLAGGWGPGFLSGLHAYYLPDNTLFVQGLAPRVTDVSVSPNYFDPSSRVCTNATEVAVSYTLTYEEEPAGGVASLASATASSQYSSSYAPSFAIDEDMSSWWVSRIYETQPWIQLDFAQSLAVDGLEVVNYDGYYGPAAVDISFSNGYTQQSTVNASTRQIAVPQQTGIQWIRLQATSLNNAYYWILPELRVFGEVEGAPGGGGAPTAADVVLEIYNTETNALVRTISMPDVPVGENSIAWDGKNNAGLYVDEGDYRLGIVGIGPGGARSMVMYVLVRVYY